MSITPEFADITDQIERKIMGINLYESQIERLFDSTLAMADAVRQVRRARSRLSASVDGTAERYWASTASDPMGPPADDGTAGHAGTSSPWWSSSSPGS